MLNLKEVEIYTKGAGYTTPKKAGFAYVIVANGQVLKEDSGTFEKATNSNAELEAALKAFNYLDELQSRTTDTIDVTLVSESQILLNWATGKFKFKQDIWLDKYALFCEYIKKYNIKTRLIDAYTKDAYSEKCDALARAHRQTYKDLKGLTK